MIAKCITSEKKGRKPIASLITALPASFMSAVSITYILMVSKGFSPSAAITYPVGIAFAAACFVYCLLQLRKAKR